ncbi:hypothetical protein B0H10DRAFT_2230598 [Mycena sp. CBHHK59/15]|nr:hypothetical protein B0H10DRAFT_2230598 [Mycena sp. CBHHK59/15]
MLTCDTGSLPPLACPACPSGGDDAWLAALKGEVRGEEMDGVALSPPVFAASDSAPLGLDEDELGPELDTNLAGHCSVTRGPPLRRIALRYQRASFQIRAHLADRNSCLPPGPPSPPRFETDGHTVAIASCMRFVSLGDRKTRKTISPPSGTHSKLFHSPPRYLEFDAIQILVRTSLPDPAAALPMLSDCDAFQPSQAGTGVALAGNDPAINADITELPRRRLGDAPETSGLRKRAWMLRALLAEKEKLRFEKELEEASFVATVEQLTGMVDQPTLRTLTPDYSLRYYCRPIFSERDARRVSSPHSPPSNLHAFQLFIAITIRDVAPADTQYSNELSSWLILPEPPLYPLSSAIAYGGSSLNRVESTILSTVQTIPRCCPQSAIAYGGSSLNRVESTILSTVQTIGFSKKNEHLANEDADTAQRRYYHCLTLESSDESDFCPSLHAPPQYEKTCVQAQAGTGVALAGNDPAIDADITELPRRRLGDAPETSGLRKRRAGDEESVGELTRVTKVHVVPHRENEPTRKFIDHSRFTNEIARANEQYGDQAETNVECDVQRASEQKHHADPRERELQLDELETLYSDVCDKLDAAEGVIVHIHREHIKKERDWNAMQTYLERQLAVKDAEWNKRFIEQNVLIQTQIRDIQQANARLSSELQSAQEQSGQLTKIQAAMSLGPHAPSGNATPSTKNNCQRSDPDLSVPPEVLPYPESISSVVEGGSPSGANLGTNPSTDADTVPPLRAFQSGAHQQDPSSTNFTSGCNAPAPPPSTSQSRPTHQQGCQPPMGGNTFSSQAYSRRRRSRPKNPTAANSPKKSDTAKVGRPLRASPTFTDSRVRELSVYEHKIGIESGLVDAPRPSWIAPEEVDVARSPPADKHANILQSPATQRNPEEAWNRIPDDERLKIMKMLADDFCLKLLANRQKLVSSNGQLFVQDLYQLSALDGWLTGSVINAWVKLLDDESPAITKVLPTGHYVQLLRTISRPTKADKEFDWHGVLRGSRRLRVHPSSLCPFCATTEALLARASPAMQTLPPQTGTVEPRGNVNVSLSDYQGCSIPLHATNFEAGREKHDRDGRRKYWLIWEIDRFHAVVTEPTARQAYLSKYPDARALTFTTYEQVQLALPGLCHRTHGKCRAANEARLAASKANNMVVVKDCHATDVSLNHDELPDASRCNKSVIPRPRDLSSNKKPKFTDGTTDADFDHPTDNSTPSFDLRVNVPLPVPWFVVGRAYLTQDRVTAKRLYATYGGSVLACASFRGAVDMIMIIECRRSEGPRSLWFILEDGSLTNDIDEAERLVQSHPFHLVQTSPDFATAALRAVTVARLYAPQQDAQDGMTWWLLSNDVITTECDKALRALRDTGGYLYPCSSIHHAYRRLLESTRFSILGEIWFVLSDCSIVGNIEELLRRPVFARRLIYCFPTFDLAVDKCAMMLL